MMEEVSASDGGDGGESGDSGDLEHHQDADQGAPADSIALPIRTKVMHGRDCLETCLVVSKISH